MKIMMERKYKFLTVLFAMITNPPAIEAIMTTIEYTIAIMIKKTCIAR